MNWSLVMEITMNQLLSLMLKLNAKVKSNGKTILTIGIP